MAEKSAGLTSGAVPQIDGPAPRSRSLESDENQVHALPEGPGGDPYYATRHPLLWLKSVITDWRPPELPGPKGIPALGVWREWNRAPHEYILNASREYGDVFRVPLPGMDMVVLNHPKFVEEVLCDTESRFSMAGQAHKLQKTTATLPIMEGFKHRVRRKAILPAFSRRNLSKFADLIIDEMTDRVDSWNKWAGTGQYVDLQHQVAMITLPTFLRSMYSVTPDDAELEVLDRAIRASMSLSGTFCFGPMTVPLYLRQGPTGVFRMLKFGWKTTNDRRRHPTERHDLLNFITDVKDEDGEPISRTDQLAEMLTLLGGGYDTVVASLSWTIGLLFQNPDALARAYEEVDQLEGRPPTLNDLNRMKWIKACFDEGQRIQGGPVHTRFVLEDTEVGGHHFRKNTMLCVGWYGIHMDPRWWTNPERYDPSRFVDRAVVAARPAHAFLPFGAGPHMCVGSGMGYMNAQLLLTIILQRFTIELRPGWQPVHDFMLSSPVKGGVPAKLIRRTEFAPAGNQPSNRKSPVG